MGRRERRRSSPPGGSTLHEPRRSGAEPPPPARSRTRRVPDLRSDPPGQREGGPPRRDLVLLGEFGRAHGLKGEVRLKSYTADPQAIAGYGPLVAEDGRSILLTGVRAAPGGAPDLLIAQVRSVASREAAESLNRIRLYLERDRLPPPDEEDEFLLAELIGLPVQDGSGTVLGTIVDVPNYGGGDLLEIAEAATGSTAFLPFTKVFVPVVNIAERRIVVAPPADLFAPARPMPAEDEA